MRRRGKKRMGRWRKEDRSWDWKEGKEKEKEEEIRSEEKKSIV